MRLEKAVGEAVRFRRKALGLSQEALAERAGLLPAAVSRLERGVGSPNLRTLDRVAAVLHVQVSQLLVQAETLLPVMQKAALTGLPKSDERED
ncbi:helix-turn-helix domain-containing protein [Cupriavidus sp. AcVe19-6a]|uniref:helix-turn-helix domain-containing protein n=1 Tax=Cupriavidus sp. AcVe19-6a TaxID=2821358 RepID=UPI001AE19DC6|nr:helix-turn-helix transcriptional regulator [Cupriavidus sp. AcVe19-6a]MBP0636305.1 helix-turn-helix transcriptional regulator [Cupriavidus sp. AcVe19-6a]